MHAPSNLDGDKSQMKAHNEAMGILVSDLNRNSAVDRNHPDKDVRAMVKLYNANHKTTLISVYDEKDHIGERPVWDVLVSIKSVSIAHRIGKKVVDKFSSGTRKGGSLLNRLRKPEWEEL